MSETKNYESVVQLLSLILENNPTLKDCEIQLDVKSVNFIKELLNNFPNELENFQQLFIDITLDGKININDVPKILSLVKSIYTLACSYKQFKLNIDDVIKISKFILTEIAKSKKINKESITQISLVLDSVASLLSVSGINTKKPINIKRIFVCFN